MANFSRVTVQNAAVQAHYVGLSTDTKAVTANIGEVTYEHDTELFFVWSGTAWVQTSIGDRVEGKVAHNAVDAGNPVKIGGVVDGSAAAVAGDIVDASFTIDGRMNVAPSRPGASETKTARSPTTGVSTTKVTLLTPTSGKKVRIISVGMQNQGSTGVRFELFFDDGATIGSDATKVIASAFLDNADQPSILHSFPGGDGPVGAVDDIVNMRTGGNISGSGEFEILYQEE